MEKEDNRRVWLGITYTVPAKPSRARVYIWRKLKELGAEYYHGMAMVPQTPRLQESIKKLVARIRELGAEGTPCLRVYNKSDLFWGDIRPHGEDAVNISAKTGEGIPALLEAIDRALDKGKRRVTLHLPYDKGNLLDLLYREAKVESVEYAGTIDVVAVCNPKAIGAVKAYVEGWVEPKEPWE